MARKKFEDGFKEKAIAYCQSHPEKTIKACAADIGVGYSTLRRWISQMEETLTAEAAPVADAAPAETAAALETALEDAAPVLEDQLEAMPAVEEVPDAAAAAERVSEPAVAYDTADAQTDEAVAEATTPAAEPSEKEADVEDTPVEAAASEAETAAPVEEAADDWEDDIAFASVGAYSAPTRPDNDDFLFRCKSNAQAAKNIPRHASDRLIAVSAQVGNVVEEVGKGVKAVTHRAGLYKKRFELQNERRKIQKEKQKRQKR